MIPYQFLNEFTASAVITLITTVTAEISKEKKKKTTKKVTTKKHMKKKVSSKEATQSSFFPEASGDDSDEEEDEETDDDEDDFEEDDEEVDDYENDEMVQHLLSFVSLMNVLDEGITAAYEVEPEATKEVYDKFDKYYAVIIPYLELVNTSYQKLFPSELKPNLDKLEKVTNKFLDDIIGDIYDDDSVGIGVQIKHELEEIMRLANIRIEDGNGRPSFESIIHTNNDENQCENQN